MLFETLYTYTYDNHSFAVPVPFRNFLLGSNTSCAATHEAAKTESIDSDIVLYHSLPLKFELHDASHHDAMPGHPSVSFGDSQSPNIEAMRKSSPSLSLLEKYWPALLSSDPMPPMPVKLL